MRIVEKFDDLYFILFILYEEIIWGRKSTFYKKKSIVQLIDKNNNRII